MGPLCVSVPAGWVLTPAVLLTVLHQRGVTDSDFQVGEVVGKTLVPPGERGEGGDAVVWKDQQSPSPALGTCHLLLRVNFSHC